MQYKRGQFVGNHGLSYTITNLTMVAIWRSNGFRIHPLIAEKKTTLLFQGTFGHTVALFRTSLIMNISMSFSGLIIILGFKNKKMQPAESFRENGGVKLMF